jgi:polyvinyl alcohol dehydrogenase (cytochrome)
VRYLPAIAFSIAAFAAEPDGSAIFLHECATCHNGAPDSRAPSREILAQRSPQAILTALTQGSMRPQGSRISGSERRAVAEFLSGKKLAGDVAGAATGRCSTQLPLRGPELWTSWGGSITNTHFQPASAAGLTADQVPRLKLKWALGFPDATSAWSQPTVAGGRVFVGSQNGTVFSLDAKSGCIAWTYAAKSGVRGAVVIAQQGGRPMAFFADTAANAYAVDAETGKEIWSRQVETHPFARISGSVVVYEGRVYMGVASFEDLFGAKSAI